MPQSPTHHHSFKKFGLAGLLLVMLLLLSVGIHYFTRDNILGSDFYIFYQAGQAIFVDHANPYSDEIAREVQMAVFKRPALPNEDQLGFAYPPYAILSILPLLALPFDWASAVWASLNLIVLTSAITAAANKAPPWLPVSAILLYPISFGLILGNFTILITAILLGCLTLLASPRETSRPIQILSGLLLAWATVKPQFSWIFILFILVFALRRRWKPLIASFLIGAVFFLLISFLLVPNWPQLWLERLQKYVEYNQSFLNITLFIQQFAPTAPVLPITLVGSALVIIMVLTLGVKWWRGQMDLLTMLPILGLAGYLLNTHGKSYDQIIYLIPFIFWVVRAQQTKPLFKLIFWWGCILFSWALYFIAIQPNAHALVIEGLFLPIAIWAVWSAAKHRRVPDAPISKTG